MFEPRRVLYNFRMSLSYLNPKCRERKSERGCAVFTVAPIPKGELISIWGGSIVHKSRLDPAIPRFAQRVLQVDEEVYILTAKKKEPNDCFNHSCEPNLGFAGQISLVAMRDIEAGEELTFDYAMSDGGPYDEFECRCGSTRCRRRVTGNDWKLPELWLKYDGYFSPYLARRIEKLRK